MPPPPAKEVENNNTAVTAAAATAVTPAAATEERTTAKPRKVRTKKSTDPDGKPKMVKKRLRNKTIATMTSAAVAADEMPPPVTTKPPKVKPKKQDVSQADKSDPISCEEVKPNSQSLARSKLLEDRLHPPVSHPKSAKTTLECKETSQEACDADQKPGHGSTSVTEESSQMCPDSTSSGYELNNTYKEADKACEESKKPEALSQEVSLEAKCSEMLRNYKKKYIESPLDLDQSDTAPIENPSESEASDSTRAATRAREILERSDTIQPMEPLSYSKAWSRGREMVQEDHDTSDVPKVVWTKARGISNTEFDAIYQAPGDTATRKSTDCSNPRPSSPRR